jgi:energy-coupling factor transport system substrate-specific component
LIERVLDNRLSTLATGLLSALAMAALLAPLWAPGFGLGTLGGWGAGMIVVALCATALIAEATDGLGPKAVAVLGALVATNAALRLAETIVQGPGGFSPIFALIVLSGYACGMRFGFLCGALSLVVSALVTGGVGPWLPYQAVVAGWVGATAGLLPGAGRRGGSAGAQPSMITRRKVAALAAFGGLWGFGYGLLLTLWGWGYLESGAAIAQEALAQEAIAVKALAGEALEGEVPATGMAGLGILRRYAVFYVATSLGWDAFRALGNVVLLLAIGRPVLVSLRRMRWWFGVGDTARTQPGMPHPQP